MWKRLHFLMWWALWPILYICVLNLVLLYILRISLTNICSCWVENNEKQAVSIISLWYLKIMGDPVYSWLLLHIKKVFFSMGMLSLKQVFLGDVCQMIIIVFISTFFALNVKAKTWMLLLKRLYENLLKEEYKWGCSYAF